MVTKSDVEQLADGTSPDFFWQVLGVDSRILREHPALIITLTYFVVSLIGMMFSWSLFRHFGVNVFDYAEITDFLMAALREPITFLVAAGGWVVVWVGFVWARAEQRFFARRPPRIWLTRMYARLSRWSTQTPWALASVIVLYAYLFVSLYAEQRAQRIREGNGETVLIQQDDRPARERVLLGTTSKLIILYHADSEKVEIVPFEVLDRIEVKVPADEAEQAAVEPEPSA